MTLKEMRERISPYNKTACTQAIRSIITAYGIEAKCMVEPASKYYINLEDAAEELQANLAEVVKNNKEESDELARIKDDIEFAHKTNNEDTEHFSIANIKTGDAYNLMELMGTFVNYYNKTMVTAMQTNSTVIDKTGKISSEENKFYADIVKPAMKIIDVVYKEDKNIETLHKLNDMVASKAKMVPVMGADKSPFLYEGFQLLLAELILTLLTTIPMAIDGSMSLDELLEKRNIKSLPTLFAIAKDVVDAEDKIGSEIKFTAPVVSDITNKNPNIEGTIYERSPILNEIDKGRTTFLSHESIANLLDIKNNKCLPEFSLIMKGLCIVAGLAENVDLYTKCKEVLYKVQTLIDLPDAEAKTYCTMLSSELYGDVIINQTQTLHKITETFHNPDEKIKPIETIVGVDDEKKKSDDVE